jgi:hypothetical protein
MHSSYTLGSRLNTTIFTTTHVTGQLDCLIVCDKEPCCRSINFKKKSSSHIEKNCEMLHNVVSNTSEQLLEKTHPLIMFILYKFVKGEMILLITSYPQVV